MEKYNPLPNRKLEVKFMYFYGAYNPRPNLKLHIDYSDDEKEPYVRKPLDQDFLVKYRTDKDLDPPVYKKIHTAFE